MTPPDGNAHWPEAGSSNGAAIPIKRELAPKRFAASAGFLLDAARRRRGGRIALWSLVVVLAVSGIGMLSYPLVTNIWAKRIQGGLEKQFQAAAVPLKEVKIGKALTRLVIPKLKVKVIVVEGTTGNALRAGAGHFVDTALPGDPTGNVAIAGHRTGFGQPFRNLHKLKERDKIELQTPFGVYIYEVVGPFDGHRNPWVTNPTDFSVLGITPEASLTLVTCDPPGTSKNRLIVRARLIDTREV